MTKSTDLIVTKLAHGPATALDLSQNIDGISYASIRQILSRLARAGIVTRLKRGTYALDSDEAIAVEPTAPAVTKAAPANAAAYLDRSMPVQHAQILAQIFSDYRALDLPGNPDAFG